jgi:ABC-type transport system involved in multi-copper enzyme maturation permease subunit
MNVILAVAKTTLGEAIRRRIILVILLIGLLVVAIAPGLSVLTARQETTVLRSLTLGVIQLTSAVIAIVLTVYLIPNEIERRTIYTILSKPVQRWQFIVGKYLGAVAALGMMMLLMTVVLLAVFWGFQREAATVEVLGDLAKAPLLFFAQMSILAAVSIFFSTFASPILNFFLSGGTYLVGSTFNTLMETIANNQNLPVPAKLLAQGLNALVPNFQNYNIQNPIINQAPEIRGETLHFITLGGYALIYIGGLLILSVVLFERREV